MSLNPVQFGSDVIDQFGRFLRTTFPLADSRLEEQFHQGIGFGPGVREPLAKGPFVHLARPFVQGPRLADMAGEPGLGMHPALPGLFSRFESIYAHQDRTYRAASAGRHVILSTGTGSGKTEGFLLPVLDHCLRLRDGQAPEGVAAVLVYPMNALVNDQLERLRLLLAGTGITFGRYTGETPDTSSPQNQLAESRPYSERELDRRRRRVEELPLPWEECFSRSSIRRRKPRLLLTNYAQLEQLLLRHKDLDLFVGAPLRFFVMDEVHTYTGSLGSEVACLLRRLRAVAGKSPDEIVCIGSSATVSDRDAGTSIEESIQTFAAKLFGVPQSDVELVTESYQDKQPSPDAFVPPLPPDMPGLLGRILDSVRDIILAEDVEGIDDQVLALAESLCGRSMPGRDNMEKLYGLLKASRVTGVLQDAFAWPQELDGVLPRLRSLGARGQAGDEELKAEALAYLTLGALVQQDDEPLLRPKFHYFIKGLGGLWVSWEEPARPGPTLHFHTDEQGDRMVYPLLICRSCGQHYIRVAAEQSRAVDTGGGSTGIRRITPLRTRFDSPTPEQEELYLTDNLIQLEDTEAGEGEQVYVCRRCGALHEQPGSGCLSPTCRAPGDLIPFAAFSSLSSCASCGGSNPDRSPLVTYITSSEVHDIMILAQVMLSTMNEPDLRKLLVFADSRQNAAFQAGWMESRSFRFRVRHLVYQVLEQRGSAGLTFNSLCHGVVDRAVETGLIAGRGDKYEEMSQKIRWLLLEEFFAATERQRRSSLEQIGLARVDYDGLATEDMGDLIEEWAPRLGLDGQGVSDLVATILDSLRRRHAVSDPMLQRVWTERDREVRRGIVSVFENFRPKVVMARTTTNQNIRSYVVGFRSERWMSSIEVIAKRAVDLSRVDREVLGRFLDDLWAWLRQRAILVDARVTQRRGRDIHAQIAALQPAWQVNIDFVRISLPESHFVCNRCHTARGRALSTGQCPSYRCDGTMQAARSDPDHFDVVQYTRYEFVPLNAREHSAQVPKDDRAFAERMFKERDGIINCLVATPTLELGVDIGQLEMVLLRNVPPNPANYAQRSGRAGRRHRIGVIFTYCRESQHDQYFYADPPQMISGMVKLPAFSLRNEPMLRKHVHSAVLTSLRYLASEETDQHVLEQTFPPYIWHYFGSKDQDGKRRFFTLPKADVSAFRALIHKHRERLLDELQTIFTSQWPEQDSDAAAPGVLERLLEAMPAGLETAIDGLLAEIREYRRITNELRQRENDGIVLDGDDKRRLRNYGYALDKRWEENLDNYTLSYLAKRGFFPGYALVRESIKAQCAQPILDVGRYPAAAIREFTPANRIYANRNQFKVRSLELYKLRTGGSRRDSGVRTESFRYDNARSRIVQARQQQVEGGRVPLVEFEGMRLIDVELDGLGRISDQQEYPYRVGFNLYSMLLPEHRGGEHGRVGQVDYTWLSDANLRMVNLGTRQHGPASPQRDSDLPPIGFPICPVCGETRSPFASQREIDRFMELHEERCTMRPGWYSLFADVSSDLLCLGPFDTDENTINAMEALRLGAMNLLEMGDAEIETALISNNDGRKVMILFDPTPGGTGFLPLIKAHWESVVRAAQEILGHCRCQKACYACMLHYRNQQFHEQLDRNRALNALDECLGAFRQTHPIPPVYSDNQPEGGYEESPSEERFVAILKERNFPLPEPQFEVDLGNGSSTIADFAYSAQRILIFIDGFSDPIHGNPAQQAEDRRKRIRAKALGWEVLTIGAQELGDETTLALHLDVLTACLREG